MLELYATEGLNPGSVHLAQLKLGEGLVGTIAVTLIGLRHPRAFWLLLLFVPLLVVALIDLLQTHHSLRRNYPVSARFRWFFEWLRPFLRSYIVESDLDGRPFSHDERALVYARAKGDVSTHPFGTELDVYSEEYEWLAHSIAPSRHAEKYTRVSVGTDQCSRPYSAARLNISAMSFGALGSNAIEALNLGARIGGFYHDTGEGGLSPYHLKHGGDIVWELGSGYFGCRNASGKGACQFASRHNISTGTATRQKRNHTQCRIGL